MTYLSIILVAFALSVDACIVSFSYGLIFEQKRLKNSSLLAFTTGAFQGIMPCIGYFLTGFVKTYIQPYANFIVFAIFLYLGINFIIEALKNKPKKPTCLDTKCLLLVGIATSIDAFSAGISLSLFGNKILKPAILIGLITLMNSYLGFGLGRKLKTLPTKRLEILAGLILILLGIKALI